MFTVAEAEAAIEAGRGGELMVDYRFMPGGGGAFVLLPASRNASNGRANPMEYSSLELHLGPFPGQGGCTMHVDGLCALHDTGFKPTECQRAFANKCTSGVVRDEKLEEYISWQTYAGWTHPEAQAMVRRWARTNGVSLSLRARSANSFLRRLFG